MSKQKRATLLRKLTTTLKTQVSNLHFDKAAINGGRSEPAFFSCAREPEASARLSAKGTGPFSWGPSEFAATERRPVQRRRSGCHCFLLRARSAEQRRKALASETLTRVL